MIKISPRFHNFFAVSQFPHFDTKFFYFFKQSNEYSSLPRAFKLSNLRGASIYKLLVGPHSFRLSIIVLVASSLQCQISRLWSQWYSKFKILLVPLLSAKIKERNKQIMQILMKTSFSREFFNFTFLLVLFAQHCVEHGKRAAKKGQKLKTF